MGIKKGKSQARRHPCNLILFSNSPLFTKTLLGMRSGSEGGVPGCLSHYPYSPLLPSTPTLGRLQPSGPGAACFGPSWDRGQQRRGFLDHRGRGCQGLHVPQPRGPGSVSPRLLTSSSLSTCTFGLKMPPGPGWAPGLSVGGRHVWRQALLDVISARGK